LESLRDIKFQAAVDARLARVRAGNFGDHKSVGDSVLELRMQVGAGLRIYFAFEGAKVVILIGGGDKRTQKKISAAQRNFGNPTKRYET
jgi:putative addiction module killer protein